MYEIQLRKILLAMGRRTTADGGGYDYDVPCLCRMVKGELLVGRSSGVGKSGKGGKNVDVGAS